MTEPKSLSERLRDRRFPGKWSDTLTSDSLCIEAAQALDAKDARIAELTALADRLKIEAQAHACEAHTANSTIYEIYQALSGATGEPGNWHGAEPARKFAARLSELTALLKEAGFALLPLSDQPAGARIYKHHRDMAARVMDEIDAALHQENKDGK